MHKCMYTYMHMYVIFYVYMYVCEYEYIYIKHLWIIKRINSEEIGMTFMSIYMHMKTRLCMFVCM
jgi:hypothetical protein